MKKILSMLLIATLCFSSLSIPIEAVGADGASQTWQDAAFNDGVYEGYYAQLNDLQKMLYDKIKEAFAEPVKDATIEFDEPIILTAADGGSFTSDDKYQWMCDNMYNQYGGRYAVFRDHPELPWLLAVDYGARTIGEWIYDDQGVSIGYRMTGMYYENTYPWVQPEAYTDPDALEKAADDAVAAIGEARPSRAATVRAILDYLCGLITYESRTGTMPDKDGGDAHTVYYDHTSYSVLVAPNKGVCNAYAAAFKLMCDRYGIPCVHLSGATTAGNHAWNYVQMEDGIWYAVDPTWSDGETIDYSYFLVGKDSENRTGDPFGATHDVPAGNDGLACPPLSDTAYPYLEAKLGDVPGTVELDEPIRLQLSDIKDLDGNIIKNGNVGLFEGDLQTPIAVGEIRDGGVDLTYDTAGSKLGSGKHPLYIKCTDGKQKGAILAAIEVVLRSDKPEFSDVAADSPYAAAISWAVERNITVGTSETTFSPDNTCTRGEIITFLWRSQGCPEPVIQNPYKDEIPDAFRNAAVWAHEKGLVSGDAFGAAVPCTRSAAVAYLWRLAGSPEAGVAVRFQDVPADSDYAKAVGWAVERKITYGTGADTFSPEAICTRGQIVTFLYRAHEDTLK